MKLYVMLVAALCASCANLLSETGEPGVSMGDSYAKVLETLKANNRITNEIKDHVILAEGYSPVTRDCRVKSFVFQGPDGLQQVKLEAAPHLSVSSNCRPIGPALPAQANNWAQARAFSDALSSLPGGQDLPRRLTFDGVEFHLAYVADSESLRFVEFIPAGQNLSRWTQMFSVFDHGASAKPDQLLAEVKNRFQKAGAPENVVIFYASENNDEHVFGYPMESADFVEYMIIHQRVEDGVTRARTFSQRIYGSDPDAVEAFRKRMLANAYRWGQELRVFPSIRPPAIGAYGNSMIFTNNGRDQGEVWVQEPQAGKALPRLPTR